MFYFEMSFDMLAVKALFIVDRGKVSTMLYRLTEAYDGTIIKSRGSADSRAIIKKDTLVKANFRKEDYYAENSFKD